MSRIVIKIFYLFFINLLKLLPRSFAIELAQMLSLLYYLFARKKVAVVRDNLKVVMGPSFKEASTRRLFKNFSFYLVDFMRVRSRGKEFFKNYLKIEGREVVDESFKASSNGVLGLGMHLGNWEFSGGHLSYLDYSVAAVALDHSIEYVDRFFKRQRKRLGIEELPFKNSFNVCLKRLKEGSIVGLLSDRDFTGNSIKGRLFGRDCYFPKAPFLISLRAQVPILIIVTVRDGLGYKSIIKGPFTYESFTLNEMHRIIADINRAIEGYLRDYPEQWFFFQRFWEKPEDVVIL
ncbi:MAG: lysophospholipid acyltransferase family protein [Candidatus Kaelpia aquatica]|nr:lysophospholipid acyltransferase family protein [Candidatus Kaelpia aquatica]